MKFVERRVSTVFKRNVPEREIVAREVEMMEFEKDAIRILVRDHLDRKVIDKALSSISLVKYEYNGWGYHLEISHHLLPDGRISCHQPMVLGRSSTDTVGFVAFIEEQELLLDVHPMQRDGVPPNFRQSEVDISVC